MMTAKTHIFGETLSTGAFSISGTGCKNDLEVQGGKSGLTQHTYLILVLIAFHLNILHIVIIAQEVARLGVEQRRRRRRSEPVVSVLLLVLVLLMMLLVLVLHVRREDGH